jgi:hypothetical protein
LAIHYLIKINLPKNQWFFHLGKFESRGEYWNVEIFILKNHGVKSLFQKQKTNSYNKKMRAAQHKCLIM